MAEKNFDTARKDIKLAARYIVLGFIMVLAYQITQSSWIMAVTGADPMTINVIVTGVFGTLTLVVKSHFETKIGE
jgi:hypothetical protein